MNVGVKDHKEYQNFFYHFLWKFFFYNSFHPKCAACVDSLSGGCSHLHHTGLFIIGNPIYKYLHQYTCIDCYKEFIIANEITIFLHY